MMIRPSSSLVFFLVIVASLLHGGFAVPPADADGVELVFTSEPGCFEAEWYSVGLKGDGMGSIDIAPGPGPVVFASLAWTGTNDTTPDDVAPGGDRADSTLILNGVPVIGRQPTGAAGFAAAVGTTWYSWSARIGPDTLGIIDRDTTRLDVSGWDGGPGPDFQRNGALLSIVYDTSPCLEPRIVQEYEGVDYFYEGFGQPHSDTVFIPVMNAVEETILSLPFGLAGSQVDFVGCRGIGLWYLAGSGTVPTYGAFDLVDNSGASGFGINEGVEIVNDPFPTHRARVPPSSTRRHPTFPMRQGILIPAEPRRLRIGQHRYVHRVDRLRGQISHCRSSTWSYPPGVIGSHSSSSPNPKKVANPVRG